MKKHWLLIASAVFSVVLAASAVACTGDSINGSGATATVPAVTATATVPAGETPTAGETPSARGEAQLDISGDWTVTELMNGAGGSLDCAATVTQAGTGLSMAIDCSGPGTFSGTIDTATGDFSLSGNLGPLALDITGTASPDGNSISGSFTFATGPSGTFHGVRQ